MEEERRLCYVGITRAKGWLYLLYTFRRTLYGESEVREPSRFLQDLPPHLVKGREKTRPARQQGLGLESGRFLGRTRSSLASISTGPGRGRTVVQAPQPTPQRFRTGDEVEHEVFGRGVVIESKVVRGDEHVTVAFAGVGLKRLMASMAPLEKMDPAN